MAAVAGPSPGRRPPGAGAFPRATALPRPKRAVTSGSPMATADPNVKSRMTAAAMSPMPSDPNGAVWESAATGPPTSTRSPVAGGEHGFDQFLASSA